MAKWRMKRGVTTLRPPPGGAHAAQMVTSYDTIGVNDRAHPKIIRTHSAYIHTWILYLNLLPEKLFSVIETAKVLHTHSHKEYVLTVGTVSCFKKVFGTVIWKREREKERERERKRE